MATTNKLVLAQEATQERSNEIKAIPALLKLLDIKITVDAQCFADAVRRHRGIENSLHWCLDVTFREDDCRIRTGHAAAIMSMLMILLKKEPSKRSIKQKRLNVAWNDSYRFKVLFWG